MHLESVAVAFLTGLGTGAHCALMCGPMACAFRVRPVSYHLSRIASYSLLGALCGGVGEAVRRVLHGGPMKVASWVMLCVLVLIAAGLDKRIVLPTSGFRRRVGIEFQRNLGWLSPLIPCGPLWLMLGVSVATGSALDGALLMCCFAVGTVVVYAAFQAGLGGLQGVFTSRWGARIQRAFVWAAAAVMAWRMWNGSPYGCCVL